jgi:hypothetical protein
MEEDESIELFVVTAVILNFNDKLFDHINGNILHFPALKQPDVAVRL